MSNTWRKWARRLLVLSVFVLFSYKIIQVTGADGSVLIGWAIAFPLAFEVLRLLEKLKLWLLTAVYVFTSGFLWYATTFSTLINTPTSILGALVYGIAQFGGATSCVFGAWLLVGQLWIGIVKREEKVQ